MNFSESDIKQIQEHGLTVDSVVAQLADFKNGFPYANIIAPATIGNGIVALDTNKLAYYGAVYDEYRQTHKIVKFVPASGAATRMFKDLFEFLKSGNINPVVDKVLTNLSQFAFYDDLQRTLPHNASAHDIISYIVGGNGLNYGNLPKGLLAFHKYSDGARTAATEHLAEGAQYATSNGTVNIHFTVSPEHMDGFNNLLNTIVPIYEQKYGVKYNITMSTQKSSTDTIAATPDNTPFRTDDGSLLFRPAGHGALIENLNDIAADIIFIKNIDNVCHESMRQDTIIYKRALAGYLVELQARIFNYIKQIDDANADINEIRTFVNDVLCIKLPSDANADDIRNILNRPIRVCGMVRNSGAPGGGPFWTRATDGTVALQIVESAQIAPDARDIMNKSSHFNPVDLVCATRDIVGNQFNLPNFIDARTGFISEKSSGGRALRAMERPGLWNGAMANWTTVFVEVPATTFTPAKVVSDLLEPAHNK